jgi:hypothetical protein
VQIIVNQPTTTTKPDVKIDPFYVLDAPDLSKKSFILKQTTRNKEKASDKPATKETPVYQPSIKDPSSNKHIQKEFSNHQLKEDNLIVQIPRKKEVADYDSTTGNPKGSYPTYGAYRAYKIPKFSSTTSVPVRFVQGKFVETSSVAPTINSPIKTPSSTLKYGDFELYLPSSDTPSISEKDWPPIYYNTIVRDIEESSKKKNNLK